MNIESHGADGVVRGGLRRVIGFRFIAGGEEHSGFGAFVVVLELAGESLVGDSGGLPGLRQSKAPAFAVQDQLAIVDEGHALGGGECLGSRTDEVNVGALLENQTRGLDGIAQVLDARHAAGLHASSVHEKGIELDTAIGGEKAAAAGVEGGIIFKDGDRFLDGIKSGTSTTEDGVAGFECAANAGLVGRRIGLGDGPRSAVYE